MVYDPELKADWRGFSRRRSREGLSRPYAPSSVLVIVASANPRRNVEVETARYYLPAGCAVIASEEATPERLDRIGADATSISRSARGEAARSTRSRNRLGPYRFREDRHYPGLIVLPGYSLIAVAVRAAIVASRFQDRQSQGVEVLVERGAGHPQRLLGRGADAQAPLLDLGRDRAQAQQLGDLGKPPGPGDRPRGPCRLRARGRRAGPWRFATRRGPIARRRGPRAWIRR